MVFRHVPICEKLRLRSYRFLNGADKRYLRNRCLTIARRVVIRPDLYWVQVPYDICTSWMYFREFWGVILMGRTHFHQNIRSKYINF